MDGEETTATAATHGEGIADKITTIADDILRGAPAIGEFTGRNERETRWAIERGWLPAWREGATWCASKAVLRRHYAELASRPVDPEALARERKKNLSRRKRPQTLPKVTMDDAPTPRPRKRVLSSSSLRAEAVE